MCTSLDDVFASICPPLYIFGQPSGQGVNIQNSICVTLLALVPKKYANKITRQKKIIYLVDDII